MGAIDPPTTAEAGAHRPTRPARPAPTASLRRVVWRWHFYAGVAVTPVILVVALTGAAYVFRAEVEDAAAGRLRFVAPGPSRVGAQAVVDLAAASRPGLRPVSVEVRAEPGRAPLVRLGTLFGPGSTVVYVDPYRARVLGAVGAGAPDRLAAAFDLILAAHRTLLVGTAGRLVVELAVGWAIVLLGTGLYLWWPDAAARGRGVWAARLRGAKPYAALRDLHAVGGFYLLAPIALIAATGLFYTPVCGEAFHLATRLGARPGPPAPAPTPTPTPAAGPAGPTLSLDRVVALARDRYPGRNLTVILPEAGGRTFRVGASNDFNNSYGEYVSAQFELDRVDGHLVAHKTLRDDPRYWWHGWAYPLHVGSVLGPASKAAWLVACLALAGLPATGVAMWWTRRPRGRTGFPRRRDRPIPRAWIALIAALGVLLPAVGASLLAILAGEWAVGRLRRGRGGSIGLGECD